MKENVIPVHELTEALFDKWPVWSWYEGDIEDPENLVCPILANEPLPEEHDALFIRAKIKILNGLTLSGNISVHCEDKRVYMVSVNYEGEEYDLPLNDLNDCHEVAVGLAEKLGCSFNEIFPLYYSTDHRFENCNIIEGEFSF